MADGNRLKLVHHHIPKTAGTSLNALLDERFDPDRIVPTRYFPDLRKRLTEELGRKVNIWEDVDYEELFERFDLFHGHLSLVHVVPEHVKVVTFLRDPIERICSLYADWARLTDEDLEGDPPRKKEVRTRCRTEPVTAIIGERDVPVVRRNMHNGMCLSLLEPKVPVREQDRMDDQSLFAEARRVLEEKMFFFGVADRLDEAVQELHRRLGWENPRRLEHLNKGKGARIAESLSEDDREELLDCNRADQMLYEWASERFAAQCERATGTMT